MRGNHRGGRGGRLRARSIPACAGEPIVCDTNGHICKVYPRVCGGTALPAKSRRPTKGLSPRVRGNRLVEIETVCAPGSIPACAGEPWRGCARRSPCRVYPRVCGGTWIVLTVLPRVPGLSPRVRGNPWAVDCARISLGSIPACAGEPYRHAGGGEPKAVYPRVCGGT